MADFKVACDITLAHEGGFSNDKIDRGGATNYGISIVTLKRIASENDGREFLDRIGVILPITENSVKMINKGQCEAIYKVEYWNPLKLDFVSQNIANLLFDMSVLHGRGNAVRIAQKALNKFLSRTGVEISVDGILGPITRGYLQGNSQAITPYIVEERNNFCLNIVKKDPSQQRFIKGWLARSNSFLKKV